MKKVLLLLALVVFFQGMPLFAQTAPQTIPQFVESDYFYHSVTIERIYIHRLGYMVIYRKGSSNQFATAYMPHSWFTEASGPGEILYLGAGREWPSMTVYYRDGSFSHVRLRVRRNKLHETWGVIPLNIDFDQHFLDVDSLVLEH
ncbi:MAG: hypothetical protein FWG77_10380 [Treponema sp.]|nr:hypothetical protein [Treponema sp.]